MSNDPDHRHEEANGDYPARRAVDFSRLGQEGRRDACNRSRDAMLLAGELVDAEHSYRLSQLAEAITERGVALEASGGLKLSALCKGRMSPGHVREYLGPELDEATEFAVRVTQAQQRRPILYEEVVTLPTVPSEASKALGVDKNEGVRASQHHVGIAACAADRSVFVRLMPQTTGTRHDWSSPRANEAEIERLGDELGMSIPGPFHEHLELLLAGERRLRDLVDSALERDRQALAAAGLRAENMSAYFPSCLLIDRLPYGVPTQPGRSSMDYLFPGDDPATISVVHDAGKFAALRCEAGGTALNLRTHDATTKEIAARHGETPKELADDQLGRIRDWDPAKPLGIQTPWDARYAWFERAGKLVRTIAYEGRGDDQAFYETQVWRWVGARAVLPAAVVLVERAAVPWPRRCLRRYVEHFAPGKIHPHKPAVRAALTSLSLAANAGGVAADRAHPPGSGAMPLGV